MPKLPSIHLYPGDWLRDDVAGCSLAAQGLWLRMMFMMHDSERYGYLVKNGSPIPPANIAARCGTVLEQYETLLAELDSVGIPRRTSEGIIYNKRMVQDEEQRAADRARQRKHRRINKKDSVSCHNRVTHRVTALSEDESDDEVVPSGTTNSVEAQCKTLYGLYPKKKAPETAFKAIRAALKKASYEVIHAGLLRYVEECRGKEPRYVKYPATWFNGGCWADEPEVLWDGEITQDQVDAAYAAEQRKGLS